MCDFLSAVILRDLSDGPKVYASDFSNHSSTERLHKLDPGSYREIEWNDDQKRPTVRTAGDELQKHFVDAILKEWPTRTKFALHLLKGLTKAQLKEDNLAKRIAISATRHNEIELVEALAGRGFLHVLNSVFVRAVRGKRFKQLKELVEKYPKFVRAKVKRGDDNYVEYTPLTAAASFERLEMVKLLLEAGAPVDDRDGEGYTPLMSATHSAAILKLLLKHGAKLELRGRGKTALLHAVYGRNYGAVKALVCAGANVNAKDDTGLSALEYADGCDQIRKYLIKKGAK